MSEPPLSPEARLEALLYQYLNLYERWSEDRQSFAQKGEALSALLAAVQTEVGQLSTLETRVQQSFHEGLQSAVSELNTAIVGVATDEVQAALQEASDHLGRLVRQTDAVLQQSFWEVAKSRWQWLGVTLVAGLLSGGLFSWVFLPSHYPFDQDQAAALLFGQRVEHRLSKLSKQDREQVFALLKKGADNTED